MVRISAAPIPRVVAAGEPRRKPLVTMGDSSSKGIVFLLTVMPTSSSTVSAACPVRPLDDLTSTSIRCVSVPPETTRKPRPCRASASVRVFQHLRLDTA